MWMCDGGEGGGGVLLLIWWVHACTHAHTPTHTHTDVHPSLIGTPQDVQGLLLSQHGAGEGRYPRPRGGVRSLVCLIACLFVRNPATGVHGERLRFHALLNLGGGGVKIGSEGLETNDHAA